LLLETIEKDEYFFVQNDEIEYIFFLFDGSASFTLPLSENKDYVQLKIGDDFGQLDILFQCVKSQNSILKNVEKKENFKRFFSV
jgi:CRP-like cAMP-binding protein